MEITPKIRELLSKARDDDEVLLIVENGRHVLAEFSPLFQSDRVGALREEDFRKFLSFKHNRHWTSLERQKNRLCSDMDGLRKVLLGLVDESRPLARRVDDALELHGMGHGTLSAILLVAYPERYGVWNGTSETAMRELGLWPEKQRGATKGQHYVAINERLNEIAGDLRVSLWGLDAMWWGVEQETGSSRAIDTPRKKATSGLKVYDARQRSVWEMKNAVLSTVRSSNGQRESVTRKNKDLRMSERELEAQIATLLEAQRDLCAISRLPFKYEGEETDFRPSLDRIDSDGHYEVGNLQVVCRFINFWKQDTPDMKFRKLLEVVKEVD